LCSFELALVENTLFIAKVPKNAAATLSWNVEVEPFLNHNELHGSLVGVDNKLWCLTLILNRPILSHILHANNIDDGSFINPNPGRKVSHDVNGHLGLLVHLQAAPCAAHLDRMGCFSEVGTELSVAENVA